MNKDVRKNLLYFIIPFICILIFKYFSSQPSVDEISLDYDTVQNKGNKTTNVAFKEVNFNFDVKPILSDKCYTCHGPDAEARQANLRLDTEEGAFATAQNLSSLPIIKRGDPKGSALVFHINSTDSKTQMPPPDSNLSLAPYQKQILEKWEKKMSLLHFVELLIL